MRFFIGILGCICWVCGPKLHAQDEFFHEIALEKKLKEKNDWEFSCEATFKHLYEQPSWSRWGISIEAVRKIKRLKIAAGSNGYYTFNKEITNFVEVRPWAAIQYNIPVDETFVLRQRLKYEWRFFFTEGANATRVNYGRLRYQIGLDIPIKEDTEASWKIRPSFEWFFIRNPAEFERFSNERDFRLMAIKESKNKHELSFGFIREVYYGLDSEPQFGYLFLVAYSF